VNNLDILTLDDFNPKGQTVLLRTDINSPLNPQTKEISDNTRIVRSLPTIQELSERKAKVVILAHQGDTLDYQNLAPLKQHADILSDLLGRPVDYIDDVAGPAARKRIQGMKQGDILLLDNVRYHTEEVSTFRNYVKLSPAQMAKTYIVRNLAPLGDLYVCDAFAAVHRPAPTLVGFPEVLPAAGGRLFVEEYRTLKRVRDNPKQPCIFVLGGAKISDAFSMMDKVLADGTADRVLTMGLLGHVMLWAKGIRLGEIPETYLRNRGLEPFVAQAKVLIKTYGDRIVCPLDFAIAEDGERREIPLSALPAETELIDIGSHTIAHYTAILQEARTIFLNGPAGVYETQIGSLGTERIWQAIAEAPAYSVIGGGDTVAAAKRFGVTDRISYVSTAGGALIKFLSGQRLPVIEALQRAKQRYKQHTGIIQ